MKNVNVSVNSAAKLSKRLLSAFIELFLVITTSYLLFTFVAIPIANKVSNYQANKEELVVETTKYYKIAKEEQYNIIEDFVEKNGKFSIEYSSEWNDASEKEKEEMVKTFNEDDRVEELIVIINELNDKINTTSNIMLISSALIPEWRYRRLVNTFFERKTMGYQTALR